MDIQHDPNAQRFTLQLDGETAFVAYRLETAKGSGGRAAVMDYYHVFVPPSHRGQGTAGRLVKFALDHARAEGWKVRPTCPYIAGQFIPRFPEYDDVLA